VFVLSRRCVECNRRWDEPTPRRGLLHCDELLEPVAVGASALRASTATITGESVKAGPGLAGTAPECGFKARNQNDASLGCSRN
jgi:hypothetical protein